jgi:hypothetical protein
MVELFAFWRYDRYPYVLGAVVTGVHDDGSISAAGYQTMRFKPLLLLPLVAGQSLKKKLAGLEQEREKAAQAFAKEWNSRLIDELPKELLESRTG